MSDNSSSRSVTRGERGLQLTQDLGLAEALILMIPRHPDSPSSLLARVVAAHCCETGSHCQLRKVPKAYHLLLPKFQREFAARIWLRSNRVKISIRLDNSAGNGKDSTEPQLPNADLGPFDSSVSNELISAGNHER
jgi:hypothetical protein